ncbi:ubiquitin carboxyl-terminal hydrolase 48-like protein [Dinothrombium tinctorium]|uniref:Ubiquitin carboxyl-terminal hydrolase 48 n=1 Tax=Dinothrombium tinctorium TaxID=1965070 RepID=A0A443RRQ6_9ACAR|nr:ubiquitin carboxyl-terminal hydrolase 48-like protein [Dinothrombium tinctorium]
MPKRQNSERLAWEWALHVDTDQIDCQHLFMAYKLNLSSCAQKASSCKRNCRTNPKCIVGLGEKKWFKAGKDDTGGWCDIDDPNLERREEGCFAGLKNLGATCYVNSLLQVWYHNPYLRDAIYKWKPDEDEKECADLSVNISDLSLNNYNPVTPVGQLQLIFAKLQFSCRRFVDPTAFVNSLELDVSQQQDAQEFSKLFLSLLEEDLKSQRNPTVKNIVQTQYCGEYEYVTRCQSCGFQSFSPSKFYELSLNIKGHKDIHECLNEFFSVEILEGSNQYNCSCCQSKQNAIRSIRLKKLPPFLNLQLLRFIYDTQKHCRKKLNSFIKFPETLNMREYFESNCYKEDTEYELCAVLVHRGQSAHSGHYIAHIKDRATGSWFKFNDEVVEKEKGKSLKLADESSDDGEKGKSANADKNAPKLAKGQHASNDAYMLVYKNTTLDYKNLPADNSDSWDIPEYLQTAVLEDNSKFEEWVQELKQMRDQNVAINKERQAEIKEIYDKLTIRDGEAGEWISKKWLSDWLNDDFKKAVPPVDNSQALCPHRKLSLKSLPDMKYVNSEGANMIYTKYGGGPRLKDALCRRCVEEKVMFYKVNSKIQEDQKKITSLLKFTLPQYEKTYWVGKESFSNWKQLAKRRLENNEENQSEDGDSDSENQPPTQNESVQLNDKLDFDFNEDLLCPHKVWNILKHHFPSAPEFDCDSVPCEECLRVSRRNETLLNEYRQLASEQRQKLQDLYSQKRRITWNEMQMQTSYYALSRKFYVEWKNFLRDPVHNDTPILIDNASLLCDHRNLLYAPSKVDPLIPDSKFIIVNESEWSTLAVYYSSNVTIKFTVERDDRGELVMKSDPPFCEPCHTILALREKEQLLNYNNATIYVRKIQSKCETDEKEEDNSIADDDSFDKPITKKDFVSADKNLVAAGDCLPPRRSTRKRKYRDVKEFILSSDQTLKDLKVMIMDEFKVATYDQHLYLNDALLEGNDNTLAALGIERNSVIYLRTKDCELTLRQVIL